MKRFTQQQFKGISVTQTRRPIVVVMGVAGVGKTTVAQLLAQQLSVPFAEADEFHSQANIKKMSAGIPLQDGDRWPWLERIAQWIAARAQEGDGGVVSCSALKRSYRDILRKGYAEAFFLHLIGDRTVIGERMSHRKGHFMPISLLDTQFEILEPLQTDETGGAIDVGPNPHELVKEALTLLAAAGSQPPTPRS